VNYKFSFSVRPDGAKKSTIPNMYQLTNEFQQLIKKYNLKVEGYLFEHNKFQEFHSEDFSEEVS
tara:strand:- start:505 stop:696 length:192 start_codon:yes stop_codon:yes gene_type:complete